MCLDEPDPRFVRQRKVNKSLKYAIFSRLFFGMLYYIIFFTFINTCLIFKNVLFLLLLLQIFFIFKNKNFSFSKMIFFWTVYNFFSPFCNRTQKQIFKNHATTPQQNPIFQNCYILYISQKNPHFEKPNQPTKKPQKN